MPVVEERRDPEKPDVAREQHLVLRQVNHEIAVGVRRDHGNDLHHGVAVVIGRPFGDGGGGRNDPARLAAVGPAIALLPHRSRRDVHVEHGATAILVRQNFHPGEGRESEDVIAVMVRQHHSSKRLVRHRPGCRRDEIPGVDRRAEGIEREQVVFAHNHTGVGNTLIELAGSAALHVRVDIRSQLPQFGLPGGNRARGRLLGAHPQSRRQPESGAGHAFDCIPSTGRGDHVAPPHR